MFEFREPSNCSNCTIRRVRSCLYSGSPVTDTQAYKALVNVRLNSHFPYGRYGACHCSGLYGDCSTGGINVYFGRENAVFRHKLIGLNYICTHNSPKTAPVWILLRSIWRTTRQWKQISENPARARPRCIISMYRLWLHGLYRLYGPRCPLSPGRPLNLITHSLTITRHQYRPFIISIIRSVETYMYYRIDYKISSDAWL